MSPSRSHRFLLVFGGPARLASAVAVLLALGTTMACTTVLRHAMIEPPRERYASWEGHRIHYLDAGPLDAEALVLVHGWASSTEAWRHQLPAWSRNAAGGEVRRVLAVDVFGHGKSDAPRLEYSMDRMAASVLAAMDDAAVERAVLVGHSNGLPVSLALARAHPDRVAALVGVDGAMQPQFLPEDFEGFFAPFLGAGWRDAMAAMMDGMGASSALSPEDQAVLKQMALDTPHHVVVGAARAQLAADAWSDAPLGHPLLLVLARQPAWTDEYETWVRARVADLDWKLWDDTGHFIQMERPDELRAAVDAFLAERGLLQD